MSIPAQHMPLAQVPMRRVRRIHLLGIGGSGMAGIAEALSPSLSSFIFILLPFVIHRRALSGSYLQTAHNAAVPGWVGVPSPECCGVCLRSDGPFQDRPVLLHKPNFCLQTAARASVRPTG